MATQTFAGDSLRREQLNSPPFEDAGDDQLSQAARFVTHLQLQLAELDRREHQLNLQLNKLNEQQQAARREARQLEEKTAAVARALAMRETQLKEAETTLQAKTRELQQQAEELQQQNANLLLDRASFKQDQLQRQSEALEKIEAERSLIVAERQTLLLEQDRQRQEIAQAEADSRAAIEQARFEFEEEKKKLHQSLADAELTLKANTEQARAQFTQQLEHDRAIADQQLRESREKIEKERLKILADVEQIRAGILQERLELQSQREEQDRLNQQWTEHRKSERHEHLLELEEISRDRLSKLDLREAELQRRDIDLQKRYRLHEDHLENGRQELASQRNSLAWQQQQHRAWAEQVEQSVRLRLSQIRRFRDVIAQREQCLADEQELFARQRKEVDSQIALQREGLMAERRQFVEMQFRERELLDERHQRLEAETAQFTEICGQFGPLLDQFKSIVTPLSTGETSGSSAESGIPPLGEVVTLLSEQIQAVQQAQRRLDEQQRTRRQEETRFTAWIEHRESWMREREDLFNRQLEELIAREVACQAERDRWHQERIEVEQVIRDLVRTVESSYQITTDEPGILPAVPAP